jgi:hypothetical protein
MATPRKHWFRVADSIGREPWSNDVLATVLRLMAAMNTRWARDGLSPNEACTIRLRAGELLEVTGSEDARTAQRRIHQVAMSLTATCEFSDTMRGAGGKLCIFTWPKWAEFQGLAAPKLPESDPETSRELPPPQPPPQPPPHDAKRESAARAAPPTPAADSLDLLDPEKLVNLLAQEPGEPKAKLAWLYRELPMIALKAAEDHPRDDKARMAGVRSRVLSHYRQHHKAFAAPPSAIPAKRSSLPDSDELSRLSKQNLLPMPTLDYWREWVAAGKPDRARWWIQEATA